MIIKHSLARSHIEHLMMFSVVMATGVVILLHVHSFLRNPAWALTEPVGIVLIGYLMVRSAL
jgi:hypothetical protein